MRLIFKIPYINSLFLLFDRFNNALKYCNIHICLYKISQICAKLVQNIHQISHAFFNMSKNIQTKYKLHHKYILSKNHSNLLNYNYHYALSQKNAIYLMSILAKKISHTIRYIKQKTRIIPTYQENIPLLSIFEKFTNHKNILTSHKVCYKS